MEVLIDNIHFILSRSALAIIVAVAGGIIVIHKKDVSHKMLCGLVSFAAGALLAVVTGHITPDAIELTGSVYMALGSILAGLVIFWIVGKYVYFLCAACAASAISSCDGDHDHDHGGFLHLGVLMIAAMTLHSVTDGLAIVAGGHDAFGGSNVLGILILVAVIYHKFPEGLALTSVSILSGKNRFKSILITILVELATAVGAFLGLFVFGLNKFWLGIVLGLVGGSFLYTVLFAIIKEMWVHEKKSILIYSTLGFISILALGYLLEHSLL